MSWCDPGDSLGKCSSLDNEWGHPDDPVTLKRPAIVALVAILQLGLWGPGLCSHCYASAKPACHEHQPTAQGHELPLSQGSPDPRDCACPVHHLCAVPPASSASISPGLGPNSVPAPVVLHATAATVLITASGHLLRGAGRASPPGRLPPLYLSHRSLLI